MKEIKLFLLLIFFCNSYISFTQENESESENQTTYKKRVLENIELDILNSYYDQDGNNAAVSGGIGTEKLEDATATIVVSIPLNEDDILTIDAGISAYSSASSSNVDPFDGRNRGNPFVASSGESQSDTWGNVTASYSHSSDDRKKTWNTNISLSTEYDYSSLGFSAGYSYAFNQKNTELSVNTSIFLDTWNTIYPYELRVLTGNSEEESRFNIGGITGTPYNPNFTPFDKKNRNSYSLGFSFSQILSKNLQMSLVTDFVLQNGLLSTPFQRVYFSDIGDSYFEDFHLADDIERLPNSRFKTAIGTQFNYYINERVSVRSFYRYYFDDWSIKSHTIRLEVPIKLSDKFTIYPSYRFYNQTAAEYFKPYNQHLSTNRFYTSDFDLSDYNANQYGLGLTYTDIFTKRHIWKFGFKQIDIRFYKYDRNINFNSNIVTTGIKFILD
ncbi:DUF3570 domain-containing protein [Tenacibaculum agarivorans]|uniref:DUF3570 domain-containing protein n=1 Tax=Tenacibaculum agarivorans TaxID=1908389 RepID=UPI00094BACCD|nr:DUF3570 domain-containing protein [Tenacibaculum agarivorans]